MASIIITQCIKRKGCCILKLSLKPNVPDFTETKVEIDAHEFRQKLLDSKRKKVSVRESE